MKKAVAIALAICFAAPNAFAASEFTDLKQDHWAYNVVNTLVDKGTVKGYEDGSFKPDGNVTRAEFAKMMGKGAQTYEEPYTDVPADHWAYDYIMSTEIPAITDDTFEPDTAITRDDAIYALWERNGAVNVKEMPQFIKNQGSAAAWAYSYGIMTGDDGIDLRLGDTITRAEAAALIVRADNSKTDVGFAAAIPDITCKTVYDGTKAFASEYSANSNITYGEFARAVVQLCHSQVHADYTDLVAKKLYESDYAKDMYVIGFYALGEDMINAEKEKQNVTREDAKMCLEKIVGVMRTARQPDFSLCLYGDTDWAKPITRKELASMLVQLDEKIGLENAYEAVGKSDEAYKRLNMKMKKSNLPASAAYYKSVLDGIPSGVYDIDVSSVKTNPNDNYYFAQTFAPVLLKQCDTLVNAAKSEYATDIKITYYPTLCYDNGTGFTMILKVEKLSGTKTAEEMFGSVLIPNTQSGNTFFVKINTKGYLAN